MKAVNIIGGILGIVLAVLAYFAELNAWMGTGAAMTMGFIGYVLIITAVAYFLISLLYKGDKAFEAL